MLYLIDGSDLSDQEFLLQWAEVGVKLCCDEKDRNYVIEQLRRSKQRLSDIIQDYLEEK